MKIIVKYTFSEKLRRAQFVTKGDTEKGFEIEWDTGELPHTIRDLLVDAIFVNQWGGLTLPTSVPTDSGLEKLVGFWQMIGRTVEVEWPEELIEDDLPPSSQDHLISILKKNIEIKPAILAALEDLKQRQAKEKDEKIAAYVKEPCHFLFWRADGRCEMRALRHIEHKSDPRVQEAIAKAEIEVKKRNEALARANAEEAAQLRAWIKEHAPELLERHDAGFLPQNDLLDAARNLLFAPLDSFARYERLTGDDLPYFDCSNHTPEFEVRTIEVLSADAFDKLKSIRAAVPSAQIEVRAHEVTCVDCDALTERTSALVSIDWRDYTLSREYAL